MEIVCQLQQLLSSSSQVYLYSSDNRFLNIQIISRTKAITGTLTANVGTLPYVARVSSSIYIILPKIV